MPFRRSAALVLGLVALAACKEESAGLPPSAAVQAYCGAEAAEVERRIDRLIDRLTLDEKLSLTHGVVEPPAWLVPGVEHEGIPPFVMLDGPRGLSYIAGNGVAFPVAVARGATFDPELERRVGAAIAHEVRAVGRNVLLAPTVNVVRHPRWGRAQETYGEDPYHLGSMGVAFVEGAQAEIPVMVKHFAANSIENTRHTVNVDLDARTLREIYLPHFRRIVRDAHVSSVMSSYNSVNGSFCSENQELLRDILKTEWEFAGPVVSDWFGTEPNVPGTTDHTVAAAYAGLDVEMPAERLFGGPLSTAIFEGDVDESVLDEMIRRSLRMKFCFGLDTMPLESDPAQLELPAARALALEVAERSIVLLQNQASALPIVRAPGLSIVVTGPLADVENIGDYGSSRVTSTNIVTALEGLVGNAGTATVTHLASPPTLPADQTTVSNADVVVVVAGLTHDDEGEGEIGAGDRDSLDLSASDAQWIADVAALSDRVVVVLYGGSSLTIANVVPSVEAVVMAWYPGVEGGNAIARVLYGDVNPSGRLPVVFPVQEADLPAFDNVSNQVTYGYFHGYRHLDSTNAAPLYPFGFGLSYTTFAYSALSTAGTTPTPDGTLTVTATVTNTGAVAGRETVQLYVGPVTSTISPRSVRDLRAFTQVELAPGASAPVTFTIPMSDLGYWDEATNAFVLEPTTYRVEVGSSSRDLPLSAEVVVAP